MPLWTYTLKYFEDQRIDLKRQYWQHNIALKHFREKAESDGVEGIDLGHCSKEWAIPEIIKHEGTSYSWDDAEGPWSWRWQDMVAQLNDASMQIVVEGEGRSLGLVGCSFISTQVYDYKREHAAKKEGRQLAGRLFEWRFCFARADGTTCYLRPTFTKTAIQCFSRPYLHKDRHPDYETPTSGASGSSGPGTRILTLSELETQTLKFDAALCTRGVIRMR